ncbi:SGNH/GDSL hydrolase family protein [Spirosoma sp. HMF4905]|uniref:SGNH/GDSL hydrolase family protein n=1 Tax=Spirosoma arboris TaxID=2682092 RepID=A0A7K1SAK3_9BACT|nr:SGNH/GDSL hydrolase family protein [Spirosoma arboris]MVM30854.1 SGNH/GDSL hydrolase family protein [Spirosoma arboris]
MAKILSFSVLLTVMMSVSFLSVAQSDTSLVKANECSTRGGLPYFFAKLKDGQAVKIAYLGGSITEAGGGWREQSLAWIRQQYPKATVEQINAAISGTGSDLGVFRLQEQVLNYQPDLVFVEFAVNDNGKKPDQIAVAMEGIVRQIWRANAHTDICFVYTLAATMAPTIAKGYFPLSASVMERIADQYAIPSIHLGLDVVRLAEKGELVFSGKLDEYPGKLVFSADNVHPYPQTGHRLYTEALARAFNILDKTGTKRTKKLKAPLYPDNWEKAQMISARQSTRSAGWLEITPGTDSVARKLANRFTFLLKATAPGERIQVRFRGTRFGLYDVMGPGCGQYRVVIDGGKPQVYPRFDKYCTYYRSNYFLLPALPEGVHTIELYVDSQTLDKAAILKQRNTSITNPQPYEPQDCYAGQFLIIGELLNE